MSTSKSAIPTPNARAILAAVSRRGFAYPSCVSARAIQSRDTPDRDASSDCVHPRARRKSLIFLPNAVAITKSVGGTQSNVKPLVYYALLHCVARSDSGCGVSKTKQRTVLGANIRRARKAAGLTQHGLASASGVSRETIASIEIGRHQTAQLSTLLALASALEVPVTDLAEIDGGFVNFDALVGDFLDSPLGLAAEPTAREIAWLRSLGTVQWTDGEPTGETVFFLLQAYRKRRLPGAD